MLCTPVGPLRPFVLVQTPPDADKEPRRYLADQEASPPFPRRNFTQLCRPTLMTAPVKLPARSFVHRKSHRYPLFHSTPAVSVLVESACSIGSVARAHRYFVAGSRRRSRLCMSGSHNDQSSKPRFAVGTVYHFEGRLSAISRASCTARRFWTRTSSEWQS